MIIDFKKNIRGAYELYANKKATGVSFFIPNGFKIDDYADKIEYKGVSQSNNVCFRITSSPSQFEGIFINDITNLNFKDGLIINVSKNIHLAYNKNLTFCEDTSVHADAGFKGYTSNDMIDGHTVHIQIDDKVQTDL